MATKAKKNQEAVAPEVAAETTTEQVVDATAENVQEGANEGAAEEATEAATEAEKKRQRNYSQSAIDTADLERLTAFKNHIKENLKVQVSNQRIIGAALDCLADNMEAFLKKLVAEASNKQRAKDLKAFEALKAKLEQSEEPTEEQA